jgi:predicted enzyme involved in methoxymalonyl-ACP biosynthesis
MGVVRVMRVDVKPDGLEIPMFVLSCRAFGIEYALLNSVKSLADGGNPIFALFRETQYNEPCRKLYPASGLKWDGERWTGRVADLAPDPAWLKVENAVAPRRLTASRAASQG